MGAFIANFQSPIEIEDLIDRYNKGSITNIEMILNHKDYEPLEWTVDRYSEVNDIVFFMCAKTSVNHMGHLVSVAKEEAEEILAYAKKEREVYKKYAGKIVAIGKVAKEPFETDDSGWESPAWRTTFYAEIKNIKLLDNPIDISDFRDFIYVSRTGSITKLKKEQEQQLLNVIRNNNPKFK